MALEIPVSRLRLPGGLPVSLAQRGSHPTSPRAGRRRPSASKPVSRYHRDGCTIRTSASAVFALQCVTATRSQSISSGAAKYVKFPDSYRWLQVPSQKPLETNFRSQTEPCTRLAPAGIAVKKSDAPDSEAACATARIRPRRLRSPWLLVRSRRATPFCLRIAVPRGLAEIM